MESASANRGHKVQWLVACVNISRDEQTAVQLLCPPTFPLDAYIVVVVVRFNKAVAIIHILLLLLSGLIKRLQ